MSLRAKDMQRSTGEHEPAGGHKVFTSKHSELRAADATFLSPPIVYRNDASLEDCDFLERGNRHVEVLERHVTPPAIVIWQCIIGWAKVCSSDGDGTRDTPSWICALDLKASSAT